MRKNDPARPRQSAPQRQSASPCREPEMRRWPHPVPAAPPETDAALHYISCALSYQNQLLADIKALLQRLAAQEAMTPPAPERTGGE